MDLATIVVPVHVHAKVSVSVPVNSRFVVFVENFYEMVGVLPPNVLDAKVVITEREQERPSVMFPKAWCDIALMVAVSVEAFLRRFCARMAACGRPYMPLCILM